VCEGSDPIPQLCPVGVMEAHQSSKLLEQVRFLHGVLSASSNIHAIGLIAELRTPTPIRR
jgi:hypothetical protein